MTHQHSFELTYRVYTAMFIEVKYKHSLKAINSELK